LLGTTELSYAMDTFPAGIMEDVFQCLPTHDLPIPPRVGEGELDYWVQVMQSKVSTLNLPEDKKEEVIGAARRIAGSFCKSGKNRIYLVPIGAIKNKKASFGDVKGLRDGKATGESLEQILANLPTLSSLFEEYGIDSTY